ncbi:hypothetical protein RI054_05g28750 [Pseudoscourfieldia marina]
MAPCHLPIQQGIVTEEGRIIQCEACKGSGELTQLLECTACQKHWHLACLSPEQAGIRRSPAEWICGDCVAKGVQWSDGTSPGEDHGYRPPNTAAVKLREEEFRKLDGSQLAKQFRNPKTGRLKWYRGVAHFEPHRFPPYRFYVKWDDGDDETMTAAEVRRHQQRTARANAALARDRQSLALPQWRQPSSNQVELSLLMQALMPGTTKHQVSRMAAALPGGRDHVADLEVVETSEQDVRDLLTAMKLDALKWILEPGLGLENEETS